MKTTLDSTFSSLYSGKGNKLMQFFFMIVFVVSSSTAVAQFSTVEETKSFAVKALQSNDIDKFVSTFSDPVELSLPKNENSFSKKQASLVVTNFLQTNVVKSFTVKQSGKSTGGAEFIIGEMLAENGNKFQVYFLMTLIDKKAYLHLIEFELL
jgi:hypothetical protein